MAQTLMQLRRLVRSRLGIPLDDDFMQDNVLDDHINLALQAISADGHWPWDDAADLVDLTSVAPDIVPPSGWRATRAVIFEHHDLALGAPADLLRMNDVSADNPIAWCPIDDVIVVRPKPNGTVRVTHLYYRQQAWLYGDGDVPTLPPQYTGAVVAKAAELLAARESSGGDASRHGSEYTSWLTRMRRDMRRSTPGVTVRVRPGGWV